MYIVLLIIVCFASVWDIIAISFNLREKSISIQWTGVSVLTGFVLFISWLILGIVYRKDPLWLNYMMSTVYAFLTIGRTISLFDLKKEIYKVEKNYYYDSETAMFRKKNEEVFNDGRPLYCASSLLLRKDDDEDTNN